MDEMVIRSLARWPDVPAVYGWLSLDRRGNWRIKDERIANAALRDFIGRNYAADERGCWFFQNGPQRVFVSLAYTPLVVHFEGEHLVDHCGRPYAAQETFQDDEGSVLAAVDATLDRKGVKYNTEVAVRIVTKDSAGRSVVRSGNSGRTSSGAVRGTSRGTSRSSGTVGRSTSRGTRSSGRIGGSSRSSGSRGTYERGGSSSSGENLIQEVDKLISNVQNTNQILTQTWNNTVQQQSDTANTRSGYGVKLLNACGLVHAEGPVPLFGGYD